jgi:hypothetical protein
VICPPYRSAARTWPKPLRRWLSSLRQIIASVNTKLLTTFRLEHERPHALDGSSARLAAKTALHNSCCWLNQHLGRPTLAFADLLGWRSSRDFHTIVSVHGTCLPVHSSWGTRTLRHC